MSLVALKSLSKAVTLAVLPSLLLPSFESFPPLVFFSFFPDLLLVGLVVGLIVGKGEDVG
jgi:hypothetical protein